MSMELKNLLSVIGAGFALSGIVGTLVYTHPDTLSGIALVLCGAGALYLIKIGKEFTEFMVDEIKERPKEG